jgi:hypothetical protein
LIRRCDRREAVAVALLAIFDQHRCRVPTSHRASVIAVLRASRSRAAPRLDELALKLRHPAAGVFGRGEKGKMWARRYRNRRASAAIQRGILGLGRKAGDQVAPIVTSLRAALSRSRLDGLRAAVAPLHALEDQSRRPPAATDGNGAAAAVRRDQLHQRLVDLDAVERGQAQALQRGSSASSRWHSGQGRRRSW